MRHAPSAPVRAGMTLIELLVVVAIIAVLASLLLPGINAVRDAARTSRCQSSLRQVGLAAAAYAGDADGRMVMAWSYGGSPWQALLAEYCEAWGSGGPALGAAGIGRTSALWGCPGTRRTADIPVHASGYGITVHPLAFPPWGPEDQAHNAYGWWAPDFRDICLAQIDRPAQRLLFADAKQYSTAEWSDWHRDAGWHVYQADIDENFNFSAQRHAGRSSVLFFDGHVGKAGRTQVSNAIFRTDLAD